MTDSSTAAGPPEADQTLWANARAITFRLLGDAELSERAAGDAVAQVQLLAVEGPGSWVAHPHWLTVLAAIAVDRSLVLDVMDVQDHPELAPVRKQIRQRLAAASPAQWVAPVVHHLAGYPLATASQLLGRTPEDVAADAALLDPSVDYRSLGQAQTAARPMPVVPLVTTEPPQSDRNNSDNDQGTASTEAATPSLRGRRHRRSKGATSATDAAAAPGDAGPRRWSISGMAVVLMLALVGAGITVTTLFPGQRASTAGRPSNDTDTTVGPDVPPLPSAGCRSVNSANGVSNPALTVGQDDRTFRLSLPKVNVPVGGSVKPLPLYLGVPAGGQGAAGFDATTDLETAAGAAAVATLEPAAPWFAVNIDQDTRRPDDIAYALAVVENVTAAHCIDLHRVVVVGSGVGGKLAGALGCVRPTVFAAVVSVGEAFLPQPCILEPPVSLLQVVPRPIGTGADPLTAPASVAGAWAKSLGTTRGPAAIGGADGAVVTDWTGGRWNSVVRYVDAPAGSGVWPAGTTEQVVDFAKAVARSS
jgi:poly(3-hydroxybutyrate) depolymerase